MKAHIFFIALLVLASFTQIGTNKPKHYEEEIEEEVEGEIEEEAEEEVEVEVEVEEEIEEAVEEIEEELDNNGNQEGGITETEVELAEGEEEAGCVSQVEECNTDSLEILAWGAEEIIKKVVCGKGVEDNMWSANVNSISVSCDQWKFDVNLDNGNGITISGNYGVDVSDNNWRLNGFYYQYKITAEANTAIKEWQAQNPDDTTCGDIDIFSSCGNQDGTEVEISVENGGEEEEEEQEEEAAEL